MPRIVSYYGSKCRLAPSIIESFCTHHCFVEVCGGSAAVLMAKPPSKIEVLNDIDGSLVNLYRVLRDQHPAFNRLLKLTPYARDEHEFCREHFNDLAVDPIERARRYFVATSQSYSGIVKDSFSRSTQKRLADTFANSVDRLGEVSDRLRRVLIENLPAEDLIAKYDTKRTLFYVDPPYDPSVRTAVKNRPSGKYRFEMSVEDHAALLGTLNSLSGRAVLSGYDSALYTKLLGNWRVCWRKSIQMASATTVKQETAHRRTEVLWASYCTC